MPLILGDPDGTLEADTDVALQEGEDELLLVTADLGIESAWFAHDADNQPLARRLYEQAALLADSAGDVTQRVQLYANMAQQSTYLAGHTGRPGYVREAVRFATRAADTARHEPLPGTARLRLTTECRRARSGGR